MNVLRLDSTTFLPNDLIEGYSSMIWTERFFDCGDFEMKTFDIEATRFALPEGALISVLDATEVMFVENHAIEKDEDGNANLVITGRTFDTFMENRPLDSDEYNVPWESLQSYQGADAVAMLLYNLLVNNTGQDLSRVRAIDPNWFIDGLVITNSAISTDALQTWWLQQGDAYSLMRDWLNVALNGVRTIRPSHTDGNRYLFDEGSGGPETRGSFFFEPLWDVEQMRIDVYNGIDRTHTQQWVDPVIFHYDSGHVDDPKYLFSSKDFRNVAYVQSSIGVSKVGPGLSETGLDQRVLFVDAGDIGDQDYATYVASLDQKGLIELAKHNHALIFDGSISPLSPYEYGKDYFLGDTVSLLAEYGVDEAMFVSEYIRTEDSEGDRGYPTLTLAS